MFVAPREGLLVRLLLVSDSLVRLFGSSGFESGSERLRFPLVLASILVLFGRIWDVLVGWFGGDLGAAPNTLVIEPPVPRGEESSKGCCCLLDVFTVLTAGPGSFDPCVAFPSVTLSVLLILFSECSSLIDLGCSECTLVVSVASMLCFWFVSGA